MFAATPVHIHTDTVSPSVCHTTQYAGTADVQRNPTTVHERRPSTISFVVLGSLTVCKAPMQWPPHFTCKIPYQWSDATKSPFPYRVLADGCKGSSSLPGPDASSMPSALPEQAHICGCAGRSWM